MEKPDLTESQLLDRFSWLWNNLHRSTQDHVRENTADVARIIQGIVPINALHNRIYDLQTKTNIRAENQGFIQWFYSLVNSWVDEKELFEKIIDVMDPSRDVFAENPKSI